MQQALKQRLVGAVVLLALAVIFLPMLLGGPVDKRRVDVPIDVPPRPEVASDDSLPPADFADGPSPGAALADKPRPVPSAEDDGAGPPRASPAGDSGEPAAAGRDDASADGASRAIASAEMGPGSWAVQVGAFGRRGNALSLRDQLRGAGFTVYVDRTGDGADTLYRVRVGPVGDREQARALKAKLASREDLEGLVVPH